MKPIRSWLPVAAVFLCLVMTGCDSRRSARSPDGAHAAIFDGDGLRICGPDGALSETVMPGEGLAEWFPDSQRLAVVCEVGGQAWQDLEKVLLPEERERVVEGGKALLDQFKAGRNLTDSLNNLTGLTDEEKNAVAACLAQKEGIKEQAGSNWDDLRQKVATLVQLRVGVFENGKWALGPPLFSSLRKFADIRVSPTGTAIAFTAEGGQKDEFQLLVIPVDRSAPPQLVAKNTAFCSDWSVDGHSLVYVHAINGDAGGDQINLGSLTRRGVLNAAGKIEIQAKADDLASLLFDVNNKVRCPGDGRIVFAAVDIHLPASDFDTPRLPQLFALDPERQPAVIPLLPRSAQGNLAYFKPAFL